MFVNERYAGSQHDSLYWNVSDAKKVLQQQYNAGKCNTWPYRSIVEGNPEDKFNSKHANARNYVVRIYSQWPRYLQRFSHIERTLICSTNLKTLLSFFNFSGALG